jgi:hypothetical protein
MSSMRLGDTISAERLRPSSATSTRTSLFGSGQSILPHKQNGTVDSSGFTDVSSMTGLHRSVLYVLGEKTQMKVTVGQMVVFKRGE